jgi:putative membrane protein
VSLMTFGITLNRFAIFLAQNRSDATLSQDILLRVRSTEHIGLGMVVLGVLVLIWSLFRYRQVNKHILLERLKPSRISVLTLTVAIIIIGAVTTIIPMVT